MVLTMRRCVEPQYGQYRPVLLSCGAALASVTGGANAALSSSAVGVATPRARRACAMCSLRRRLPTIP